MNKKKRCPAILNKRIIQSKQLNFELHMFYKYHAIMIILSIQSSILTVNWLIGWASVTVYNTLAFTDRKRNKATVAHYIDRKIGKMVHIHSDDDVAVLNSSYPHGVRNDIDKKILKESKNNEEKNRHNNNFLFITKPECEVKKVIVVINFAKFGTCLRQIKIQKMLLYFISNLTVSFLPV